MSLPTQEMRRLALLVLDAPYDYGQPASDLACHVLALSDENAELQDRSQTLKCELKAVEFAFGTAFDYLSEQERGAVKAEIALKRVKHRPALRNPAKPENLSISQRRE